MSEPHSLSIASKSLEVSLKAFLPVAFNAAREVSGNGENPFLTKEHSNGNIGEHIEEVSGIALDMMNETTKKRIEEHLHRGAAVAVAAGEALVSDCGSNISEKYRGAISDILGHAGYDIRRVFSSTILPAVRTVGQFAGNLFSSMVERGSRAAAATGAVVAGAALSALLLTASPLEGAATKDYSKRFDDMVAASLSMEEGTRGIKTLSEYVEKAAVTTLEHEAKKLSISPDTTENNSKLLKTVVNRAALERDISSVRFLALLAEKGPSRKKNLVERFRSENLDFVCVAERMEKDFEFLRTCAIAAGMKDYRKMRPREAVKRLFEEHAGIAFPKAHERNGDRAL